MPARKGHVRFRFSLFPPCGYSLASRELIADSVETLLTAHCFDGAVLIEAYKDDYKEIAELKDSADYLKEILYKRGF